jgi:hypothetical protein
MLSTAKLWKRWILYRCFGFHLSNFVEDWGWAGVCFGEIEMMFAHPNAHLPFENQHSPPVYFNVENADEMGKLKEKPRSVIR